MDGIRLTIGLYLPNHHLVSNDQIHFPGQSSRVCKWKGTHSKRAEKAGAYEQARANHRLTVWYHSSPLDYCSFFTKWEWLQELYPNVVYIDDTIIAMTHRYCYLSFRL